MADKIVYQSEFRIIYYDAETQLITDRWQAASDLMLDDDFKTDMLAFFKATEAHDIHAIVADTRDFKFTVSPDLQQWHEARIVPIMKHKGIRKMAVIVSEDAFARISVEQTTSEAQMKDAMQTRYFDDASEARRWAVS